MLSLGSETKDSGRDLIFSDSTLDSRPVCPSRNTKERHDWERTTEGSGFGVLFYMLFQPIKCHYALANQGFVLLKIILLSNHCSKELGYIIKTII